MKNHLHNICSKTLLTVLFITGKSRRTQEVLPRGIGLLALTHLFRDYDPINERKAIEAQETWSKCLLETEVYLGESEHSGKDKTRS